MASGPEAVGDLPPLLPRRLGRRLGEDRADGRRDQRLGGLRHQRQGVAQEVDPAALPARPVQHRRDRLPQSLVGVAGHQLHPGEAPRHQAAQKGQPEGPVLARPDVDAQHLARPVAGHPDGDHHRLRDDPAVVPHLDEGGVQPHVGIGVGQRPAPEALDLRVQLGAEAADLALADPLQPQGLDQLVHPPRRDPAHVRLLHHRHQRPLGPRARLQQAREVAPVPHPRHPQPDRPHPRVPGPLADAVALPASAPACARAAPRPGAARLPGPSAPRPAPAPPRAAHPAPARPPPCAPAPPVPSSPRRPSCGPPRAKL